MTTSLSNIVAAIVLLGVVGLIASGCGDDASEGQGGGPERRPVDH